MRRIVEAVILKVILDCCITLQVGMLRTGTANNRGFITRVFFVPLRLQGPKDYGRLVLVGAGLLLVRRKQKVVRRLRVGGQQPEDDSKGKVRISLN